MPKSKHTVEVAETLRKLIPKFLKYQEENISLIQKSLEISNYHEIARIGHIIKGASGSYGFSELTKMGNEIELAAKSQKLDLIKNLVEEYQDYLKNIKIIYKK